MKISNKKYLKQAQLLTENEKERLLSRMAGKLPRKLEKEKLSMEEALALQLEFEDEQLQDWREKMHSLKEKHKAGEKATVVKTPKAEAKPKVATKPKTAAKPKTEAKPKAATTTAKT